MPKKEEVLLEDTISSDQEDSSNSLNTQRKDTPSQHRPKDNTVQQELFDFIKNRKYNDFKKRGGERENTRLIDPIGTMLRGLFPANSSTIVLRTKLLQCSKIENNAEFHTALREIINDYEKNKTKEYNLIAQELKQILSNASLQEEYDPNIYPLDNWQLTTHKQSQVNRF